MTKKTFEYLIRTQTNAFAELRFPSGFTCFEAAYEEDFTRLMIACKDAFRQAVGLEAKRDSYDHYLMTSGVYELEESIIKQVYTTQNQAGRTEADYPIWDIDMYLEASYSADPSLASPAEIVNDVTLFYPIFEDDKVELLRNILGDEYDGMEMLPGNGCFGHISLFADANAIDPLEMVEQFADTGRIGTYFAFPAFRFLDVKRKKSVQSEQSQILEGLIARIVGEKDELHKSRRDEGWADQNTGQLMGLCHDFKWLSNVEPSEVAEGVTFDGNDQFGSCYGGQVLSLIGINDFQLIQLEVQWDVWVES